VQVCIFASVLALVCIVVFPKLGLETANTEASHGIVSLEFAGNLQQAEAIKSTWTSKFGSLQPAWISLFLDFGFIVAYSTALGLACILAHEMFRVRDINTGLALTWTGELFAWGATVAGALDVLENVALIVVLRGTRDEIWPQLAYSCAALKFALVFAAIAYTLAGVAFSLPDWWAWVSARLRSLSG
jgi:hypothetical protein